MSSVVTKYCKRKNLNIPIVEGKEIAEALACYICFLSYYPRILFSKEYMQIRPLECSAKYGNNKYLRIIIHKGLAEEI
ncbi:hypothetical protein T02_6968 [Trichinella nativa]|uniref:Uncharacterized protein n=1 Tax=Trichinella nativa TaxID=6335 RepID=A0A0V1LTN0_9BILA|nr:hypothetical protein T02_6968 [Trichinella nativa]